MFWIREPLTAEIRDFLSNNALASFSYRELGCTKGRNVGGYNTDRYRIQLGSGPEAWERAKRAVRDWRMLSLDWARMCWPYKKLVPGTVIAVKAHHFGFYSLHAAKIVYVVDEPARFGVACGTLKSHALSGEESFQVYQENDGKVFFELTAISKPQHWLAWVFYPLLRQMQSNFAKDALHAMLEAITALNEPNQPADEPTSD